MKLPIDRASEWSELKFADRTFGAELMRLFGNDGVFACPLPRLADRVCKDLGVDGRERPTVRRAIDRLIAAGLLVADGSRTRLLYAQGALDDWQAKHPANDQTTARERPVIVQSTAGHRPVNAPSTTSESEPSPRNHSNHVSQIEEIDQIEKREGKGAEHGPPSRTLAKVHPREPLRHMHALRLAVDGAFFRADVDAPDAMASQWQSACRRLDRALDRGAYPTAQAAMDAFAVRLVQAVQAGAKLGFALLEVPVTGPWEPAQQHGRADGYVSIANEPYVEPARERRPIRTQAEYEAYWQETDPQGFAAYQAQLRETGT